MFKPRHVTTPIVDQQPSDDELSTVFGGQSREADDVSKQFDETRDEWIDALAPFLRPIDSTIRLIGLTERLVQRSFDHDARWAISDQEAARLNEKLSDLDEVRLALDDADSDEAALAAGSAAMNAAAHAFHGQQSASAGGHHNPSPNTSNPGPGPAPQSSAGGGPYR